jgi:hypothetical protein
LTGQHHHLNEAYEYFRLLGQTYNIEKLSRVAISPAWNLFGYVEETRAPIAPRGVYPKGFSKYGSLVIISKDNTLLSVNFSYNCPEVSHVDNRTYQFWFGTHACSIGYSFATGPYPQLISGVREQLEQGQGGLVHYQVLIRTSQLVRRTALSKIFPGIFLEPSRSNAAREYVWKEESRIGEPFEWGDTMPTRRNDSHDWEAIRKSAQAGDLGSIPADIFCRLYNSLRRISSDFVQPPFREVTVQIFWGDTGSGKSHKAWEEAGSSAYSKDPLTKWWDGYQVIDTNLGSN